MTLLLYRLGRGAVRRRRLVVVVWVVAAIGILVLGQAAGGESSDEFSVPGVESQRALDVLEDDFPAAAGTSAQLVFAADEGSTLTSPDVAAVVATALSDVAAQPDVGGVGELQLSPDGTVGLADVQYAVPSDDIREAAFGRLEGVAEAADDSGLVTLELGGELPSEASGAEPGGEELIGLAVAMVVLLVAFGSVVAMGLPIGVALVGLLASVGLITVASAVVDVSNVAPTLASMIGLGVGIDYALFIVTRHRENLHKGMSVEEAVGRAIATSGSAVLFAGITVVIAITGLAIAGIPAVTVMGLMSGLTVAVMVAVALTLLPALLGFAGHKVNALRLPGMRASTGLVESGRESLWHRWGRQVSAHPWRYLTLGMVVLGLASAPVLSLRLGWPDNGSQSEELTTRRAYDLLADGFGDGFNGPLVLSVELGSGEGSSAAVLDGLSAAVDADPGVEAVAPPRLNDDGTAAVLRVIPTTSPQDEATNDLIHRLRDDVVPEALASAGVAADSATAVHIGGATASFIDLSEKIQGRLLWFIGAVILLSVLLLMVVFRSIAVPLKAAVMNLLSIGAAYGVIVAVFQWGWGRSLFGVEESIPIVSFLPMMLFAILFGLSMDYEVFLLSRVREEYLARRDSDSAVIEGIAATGRVITSAALIMISVFAAFALGDDPTIKMFGLGLATAVLVDATIVRMVLVPATMRLLGDWNWWLPSWLDRILPTFDLEGGTSEPAEEEDSREPVLVG
ncbi:MAG TPA: MMPL family transporter [Acidimicrobiales bacterium]|nr:MMPL family transporter [Acidimicrobiales bacterium]